MDLTYGPDDEAFRARLRAWLETDFAGGRHARRVDKIADIERRHPEGRR